MLRIDDFNMFYFVQRYGLILMLDLKCTEIIIQLLEVKSKCCKISKYGTCFAYIIDVDLGMKFKPYSVLRAHILLRIVHSKLIC